MILSHHGVNFKPISPDLFVDEYREAVADYQRDIVNWNPHENEGGGYTGYRTDPAFSPEVHAGITPKIRADQPIGQWNTFHIIMKQDSLTVNLNGHLVLDNAQLPGIPTTGPIALQHHGDRKDREWGASFLQFRNLFIK